MKTVIGLPVDETTNTVKVADLVDWIEARDASCAEYLVDALREFLETGGNDGCGCRAKQMD